MIDWKSVLKETNVRCDCLDEEAEFLLLASQYYPFDMNKSVFKEITEKLPSADIWQYPIYYYMKHDVMIANDNPNSVRPICSYYELVAEEERSAITIDDLI